MIKEGGRELSEVTDVYGLDFGEGFINVSLPPYSSLHTLNIYSFLWFNITSVNWLKRQKSPEDLFQTTKTKWTSQICSCAPDN